MSFILSPKIIEGEPFDWKEGAEWSARAVDEDGEPNFHAAMCADPGVIRCTCDAYLWREGDVIECPACGTRHNLRDPR